MSIITFFCREIETRHLRVLLSPLLGELPDGDLDWDNHK